MNVYINLETALEIIKYEQGPNEQKISVPSSDLIDSTIFNIQRMLVEFNDLDLFEVFDYQRLFQELLNNASASAMIYGGNVEAIAYSGKNGYIYGTKQTSKFFNEDQVNAIMNGELPKTTWNDEHGGEGIQLLLFNSDAIVLDIKKKIIASVNSLELYVLNQQSEASALYLD